MNPILFPAAPLAADADAAADLSAPPESLVVPLGAQRVESRVVPPAEPLALAPSGATALDAAALADCARRIRDWGRELGFSAVGISDTDLQYAEAGFNAWLAAGYHGAMDYMAKHGTKRTRPAELVPGTLRVISVRLPYLPATLFAAEPRAAADPAAKDPATAGLATAGLATADLAAADLAASGRAAAVLVTTTPAAAPNWRARELGRLDDPTTAIVSVYARGRDYHKVLRQRLQMLAERITAEFGVFGYRVFTDSAPVLEVELARKALLGWRGKHTLLLDQQAGSLFFLGEIYVDLPLPVDALEAPPLIYPADAPELRQSTDLPAPTRPLEVTQRVSLPLPRNAPELTSDAAPASAKASPAPLVTADGAYCGSCTRCITACPTGAIVGPYRVDARRCISYLTIELKGSIPLELRPLIGNRVYGCDDCQLVCPWNKFAQPSGLPDFDVRNGLDRASLLDLFAWSAEQFETRLAGSAIRRIGHERWLRNLAVALGNALRGALDEPVRGALVAALRARSDDPSALVREHVEWALAGIE